MTDIIFLRPYFFILFLPLFVIFYFSSTRKIKQQSYISAHLLAVMIKSEPHKSKINIPLVLFLFACLIVIALAGPATPQKTALTKSNMNTVILLGMDKTMHADDLKPSRLALTKQKLIAFLEKDKTTNTALIAFAGTTHIISPFTDDHTTLIHFINALNPEVMPKSGSNVPDAVKLANSLITQLKPNSQVRILLVTDQLTVLQSEKIVTSMKNFSWPIDIVFVGTPTGSVVPLPEGGLLRTPAGQLIVAKTPLTVLKEAAEKLHGDIVDINSFDQYTIISSTKNSQKSQNEIVIYNELGYFVVIPLLFMCLLFRRGYILCVLFLISTPHYSFSKNTALDLYEKGKYQQAADSFHDFLWKGNAMYRMGKFDAAIIFYEKINTDVSNYNRGNALAHIGKIKEAILAYRQALQLNPNLKEAKDNKNILEAWLKTQTPENKEDEAITALQNKSENIEKALSFLKALPEEPGDLMQKRLQLQQKNKSD